MEQMISYVINLFLGVGVVWAIVGKLITSRKYLSLSREVVDFVDEAIKSLEDKNLTYQEIKKLAAEFDEIKAAYKLIRGKK